MEEGTKQLMDQIAKSIEEAGYVPYDQLSAYLRTMDDRYITRNGNARTMIRGIDRGVLIEYLDQLSRH